MAKGFSQDLSANTRAVQLSRAETVSLIALLTAQLANRTLNRHQSGECASFIVRYEEGADIRMILYVDPEESK
jgi:hypothetical protein